jgi:hypothetical protein
MPGHRHGLFFVCRITMTAQKNNPVPSAETSTFRINAVGGNSPGPPPARLSTAI